MFYCNRKFCSVICHFIKSDFEYFFLNFFSLEGFLPLFYRLTRLKMRSFLVKIILFDETMGVFFSFFVNVSTFVDYYFTDFHEISTN